MIAQGTHGWELQGGLKLASECEVLVTGIPVFQASEGPHLFSPGGLPFLASLSNSIFLLPSLLQLLSKSESTCVKDPLDG